MLRNTEAGSGTGLLALVKRLVAAPARSRLCAVFKGVLLPVVSKDLPHTVSGLSERIERLERQVFATPYVNPEFIRANPDPSTDEFDYVGFEQKFRGPTSVVQQKLKFYVQYFFGRPTIVDLGCGRGEFPEVLREAGVAAVGVEVHPRHAAEARCKGLNVVESDLFDYLLASRDESLDGIFSVQVVEHLLFTKLNTLFNFNGNFNGAGFTFLGLAR